MDRDAEPRSRIFGLLGWSLVAATLVLLCLVKIPPADVAWHLATARLAEALGHWPTRNTFSWTFPDYPLYQQYPVFQTLLSACYGLGGWKALSGLVCLGWVSVFTLFVRAAGPLPRALPFFPFWALVAFSVQTRASLRPDLLSLGFLASYLIILHAYRRRRLAVALIPVIHWLWVNGHQLFILSFIVQLLFLGHLVLARWGRWGVDRQDAGLPLAPPLGALLASAALTFASPLGTKVLDVFAHTAGSLAHHRDQVDELARVWSDPLWSVLALAILVPVAVVLYRGRRTWNPFEVGLWLVTVALAASAVRGLVYATLVSGVIFQRLRLREAPAGQLSPLLRGYFRWLGLALAAVLPLAVLQHRWLNPPSSASGPRAGLGRTDGDWPDAAIATLKRDPPPGRMMNLSWTLANPIIWAWPEQAVFVDARFEAYPRAFLIDALASRTSDAILERLLATHRPGWLFVEHCSGPERARAAHLVRGGGWQLTYADALTLVLVSRVPSSEAYRARHPFIPAREPPGLLAAPPLARAHQRLCYGRSLAALGFAAQASAQLAQAARDAAGDEVLRAEIARAAQGLPDGTSAQ